MKQTKMENIEIDSTNVCRTCLSNTPTLKSVFDVQICDKQTVRMVDFVRKMTSVKIVRGDGLPENLCNNCIEEICKAYSFAQLCSSSDSILKSQRKLTNKLMTASLDLDIRDIDNSIETRQKDVKLNQLELSEDNFEIIQQDNEDFKVKTELGVYSGKESSSDKYERVFYSNLTATKPETAHSTPKSYQCQECSKTFMKRTHLSVHMRSHITTDEKQHTCSVCGKKFMYLYLLKQHSFKHTDEKPYPCVKCDKGCLTAESLRRHMKTHEANYKKKRHVCNVCLKEFPYPSFLAEHMKNHTGEKPFLCSTCGKGFRQSGALEYHIRSHTGLKPYKCQVCNNSFGSKGVLRVHMRRHTDERPYVCDICGMAFRQFTDMKSHRRTHTGDKRALCTVCGKRMSTTGQLTVHLRTHTGEKPFSCEVCHKAFITRTTLIKHKRIHTGEKPYMCTICGRSFNQSSTLKTHGLTHQRNKAKGDTNEGNSYSDAPKLLVFNIVKESNEELCVVQADEKNAISKEDDFSQLPTVVSII